jgi:hypothetical protein
VNPVVTNLDGHALAARYETLRQEVMAPGDRRHTVRSLALLMRKGMAAWMKSVEEVPVRAAATAAIARSMPEGIERSLVDIVATMALTTALEGVT